MSEEMEKKTDSNAEDAESKHAETDLDWENRVLCSDGNCIGVIGPDGRCKECGKPYEGQLPNNFQSPGADRTPETSGGPSAGPSTEKPASPFSDSSPDEPESSAASGWEDRVLCSDGNCIGVIGPDGRCKECGKPYDPENDET